MLLTRLFVRRPALVFVMIAFVTIAGCIALKALTQQQYPNIDLPTITVQVRYPGASPSEMRDAIVRPLEDNIAGAPDLSVINTTVLQGAASISAVFNLGADVNSSLVEVQRRVQATESLLPTDLKAPTISTFDPSESTVVSLGVSTRSLTQGALSDLVTNQIIPALEQVDGVGFVNANGTVTPSFEVTVDPVSLQASGYTINDIVNTLAANNTRLPGGIVYQPSRETLVDVRGDIQTAAQVANLPLEGGSTSAGPTATAGQNQWSVSGTLPKIGDVATVTDGFEAQRVFAYVNGAPQDFLQVQKTTTANEVTTSDNVIAALPRLEAEFPAVSFSVINVQSRYTQQQLTGVLHTLLEGITLTAIVMVFFLGSWRNAVIVLIAIPTSLLITLVVMKLANFTIDTISLLAMTLVVGILVDDSIVVLENIQRHHHEGEEPLAAAVHGRSEIGFAAIVITLVDVVVFLPIAFLPGVVGKLLSEFAICVVVATLTSLWTSFTVTPTLAGRWSLRSQWKAWAPIRAFERGFDRVREWYAERLLPGGLRRPWLVVGIAAASVVVTVIILQTGLVGFTFIPSVDRGEIFVQITFPTGTPLTTTDAAVRRVDAIAMGVSDAQAVTGVSGAYSSPFGGFISEGSIGQVHLFLKDDRKHSTTYWVDYLKTKTRSVIPDANVVVIPATSTSGGNSQPIDYIVSDIREDPTQYAQRILQVLHDTPGALNATSSGQNLAPQVEVDFDRAAAQALGVSIGSASSAIRAALGGVIATQFESVNGLKDVQVIYPVVDQTSLAEITAIPVRADNGSVVTVGDVATLKWAPAQPVITRVNRASVIHVTSNIVPGAALSNVQNAFLARVAAMHLPTWVDVHANPNGNQQNLQDTRTGMGAALALSFVLVYLLMVALYNNYITPLVIMFSVPVASIGALTALFVTGQTLNLFSLIGIVMLVGLVSKNGILLVDYANTLRRRGFAKMEALRRSARIRFRPIIMTTCAMIAGMTPLAAGLVQGSQVRQALGIVVIGGLTSSLLLTLVLVPVAYMWLAPEKLEVEPEIPEPTHEIGPELGDVPGANGDGRVGYGQARTAGHSSE
jgi:hydrophobic/amphiphilic exporter-1 (mainly G- bacteria), HAE1 family